MIPRDSTTGRAITWLQFPLAMMVFTAHTTYNTQAGQPLLGLLTFTVWAIPVVSIPVFFLLSGYLFFAGRDTFEPSDYLRAMRRRARTLLLPYVLWMLIAWITVSVGSGELHRFSSLTEFIKQCWGGGMMHYRTSVLGTYTITISMANMLYTLWFLRDLMCISLLTPLIWLAGKYLRLWAVIPFAIIYFAGVGTNLNCLQPTVLFYFPAGAILAINRVDIASLARKALPATLPAWILLSLAYTVMALTFDIFHLRHGLKSVLLYQFMKISGMVSLIGIAVAAVKQEQPARLLARINSLFFRMAPATMFIYLVQGLRPIEWLNTLSQSLFEGTGAENGMPYIHSLPVFADNPQLGQLLAFLSAWVLRLVAILATYALLRRYAPRTLSVLTGGRSQTSGAVRDNHMTSASTIQ